MFHSGALSNRINRIRARAKTEHKNKNISFSERLEFDNAVNIHQKNLQILVTASFKVKNDLPTEIIKQIFVFQEPYYNFRSETLQFRRKI